MDNFTRNEAEGHWKDLLYVSLPPSLLLSLPGVS